MKRRLILFVTTLVLLGLFGVVLHSPPGIDAISGATRRARAAAARERALISANEPEFYYIGISTELSGLMMLPVSTDEAAPSSLRLAVVEDDRHLMEQAKRLRDQMEPLGISLDIQTYNEVMFYSRAYYGKFDILLVKTNEQVAPEIDGAAFVPLDEYLAVIEGDAP